MPAGPPTQRAAVGHRSLLSPLYLCLSSAALLTLIRWIPASMRSCSTSFRAWAMLLVADIVCHQLWAPWSRELWGEADSVSQLQRPQDRMQLRTDRQDALPPPCSPVLGTGHAVCVLQSEVGGLAEPLFAHKFPPVASRWL